MRHPIVLVPIVAGAALIARRAVRHACTMDFGALIDAMPDTAPPTWMFTNIAAIRRNTERILELLESQAPVERHGRDALDYAPESEVQA